MTIDRFGDQQERNTLCRFASHHDFAPEETDFLVIRERDWFCDKCAINASSHCFTSELNLAHSTEEMRVWN